MFVAFYLRRKINEIQAKLARTSLVIVHVINCLIVVAMLVVENWTDELEHFNYVAEILTAIFAAYLSLF